MEDVIREAPLGQVLRWVTGNRILKYPEERSDFKLPDAWVIALDDRKLSFDNASYLTAATLPTVTPQEDEKKEGGTTDPSLSSVDIELSRTISREQTLPFSEERLEVDERDAIERTLSRPIAPTKTQDGNILVHWYNTDDPANPQNWSKMRKAWISVLICLYTFVVYCGSAIYTSSEAGVMKEFGVNNTDAALPLALYVLAYGLGPLIFAPMSEIPVIGRSPVYFATFFIFMVVSIPAGFVQNFAGLLVLRFLQGFFGSPCLANGAATMQDVYSFMELPYALIAWVAAAYSGPALGPLISAFAVTKLGWRWSLYEIAIATGPVLVLMFSLLPETSAPNLLLRRAQRLRALTGDSRIMSESEIATQHLNARSVLIDAMIKPLEITIKDPAIAFVNLYTALVYGIYYMFFEVFPLVFPVYYGFSLGMIGVVFLCVLVACLIGVTIYIVYLKLYMIPDILRNGLRAQEHRLVPALFACFGPPVGLFIFAWTADTHWIAPTIGIVIYGSSVFIVMQCIFTYVPMSYPSYAASLFAANDFFRSALACGSILFARPLFLNLGVAKGTTLLAGLSTLGVFGMFVLWVFGARLRKRSKFATS